MRFGFNLIEVLIVVVILGIVGIVGGLIASALGSKPSEETLEDLYHAWSEIHPEVNLNFDEWKILYDNHMLPEQVGNRIQNRHGTLVIQ